MRVDGRVCEYVRQAVLSEHGGVDAVCAYARHAYAAGPKICQVKGVRYA